MNRQDQINVWRHTNLQYCLHVTSVCLLFIVCKVHDKLCIASCFNLSVLQKKKIFVGNLGPFTALLLILPSFSMRKYLLNLKREKHSAVLASLYYAVYMKYMNVPTCDLH